jgi:hypothetical protein
MAKRKTTTQLPDVQKEHYLITKAGVKVYPEWVYNETTLKWKWHICINNNGKIQMFEKTVTKNEINLAIHNTILYCYKRLTEK